jgi:hypothetical protein
MTQNCPTRVEVDASGFATGGILSQKHEDGLWHPVAYRSDSMSKEERNYEIYDREMLGCIRAFEDWRHFLKGIPFRTRYRPQEYRVVGDNARSKSATSTGGSLYLSRFDFKSNLSQGRINASRRIKSVFEGPCF